MEVHLCLELQAKVERAAAENKSGAEEYVRQLEQLVETNPGYVDLRLHYGMGTLMKSNFLIHRSLKEMNKAIEVNPNFQQAKTTADTLTDIYKKMLQTVKSVYHSGGGQG